MSCLVCGDFLQSPVRGYSLEKYPKNAITAALYFPTTCIHFMFSAALVLDDNNTNPLIDSARVLDNTFQSVTGIFATWVGYLSHLAKQSVTDKQGAPLIISVWLTTTSAHFRIKE